MTTERNNPAPPTIVQNIAISYFSTAVARTVFYPIDTLKTNLQYSNDFQKLNWRLVNPFKGLGVTLLLACPAGAMYLSSYDALKNSLATNPNLAEMPFLLHSLCGAGAEFIASLLFTPMDVLKQKLQVDFTKSTTQTIKDLYVNHGISGFYRGFFMTQMVFVPFSAIYFSTYERTKFYYTKLSKKEPNLYSSFGSSIIAASVAAAVTNPIDVIKTRIQIKSNVSSLDVVKDLYRNHGYLRAFCKGLIARILWAAPSMSLSVSLWEVGKNYV